MLLGKFQQQPAETLDYDIDFAQFLSDGDTLVTTGNPPVPSPLDVVISPAGTMTLGPTVVINGTVIKQWLIGGTSGQKYKITITATSNAGRVKQVEFIVRVKDE